MELYQYSTRPNPPLSDRLDNSRQRQLTATLPSQNLRNSMSNRDRSLLSLLLREASCNAYFERRLQLPALVFGALNWRHALEASDENAVCKCLLIVSFDPHMSVGEGIDTSSTHSCNSLSCSSIVRRREFTISGFSTSN